MIDVAKRAERLYLVLAQLRGVPCLSPEEAINMTPLTQRGLATVPEVTDEDLALATSLVNVETELREKQYDALGQLGSLVAGKSGSLDNRVLALGGREFAEGMSRLLVLGWLDWSKRLVSE